MIAATYAASAAAQAAARGPVAANATRFVDVGGASYAVTASVRNGQPCITRISVCTAGGDTMPFWSGSAQTNGTVIQIARACGGLPLA